MLRIHICMSMADWVPTSGVGVRVQQQYKYARATLGSSAGSISYILFGLFPLFLPQRLWGGGSRTLQCVCVCVCVPGCIRLHTLQHLHACRCRPTMSIFQKVPAPPPPRGLCRKWNELSDVEGREGRAHSKWPALYIRTFYPHLPEHSWT